jgi:hypothetical protein
MAYDRPMSPNRWVAASRARLAAGALPGALAEASEAVRSAPDDGDSHAELSVAAERAGQLKLARDAARAWVARRPDQSAAHARLGEAYLALNKVKPARRALGRAVALDPGNRDAANRLAILTAVMGRKERRRALEHVERLVDAGALPASALPEVVDATVEVRTRWWTAMAAYATLGYAVMAGIHVDDGSVGASTWPRAAVASAVVVVLASLWLVPLWTRLTPRTRRLLPGLVRRDGWLACELVGNGLALAILVLLPAAWTAGQVGLVLAAAITAFALPFVTEVVTVAVGLGREPSGRGFASLLLLPPYSLVAVILLVCVLVVLRLIFRAVRWMARRTEAISS